MRLHYSVLAMRCKETKSTPRQKSGRPTKENPDFNVTEASHNMKVRQGLAKGLGVGGGGTAERRVGVGLCGALGGKQRAPGWAREGRSTEERI